MSQTTPASGVPLLTRQGAIEDHLNAALDGVQGGRDVHRAAFHANRAASILNQACATLKRTLPGRDGAA